MKRLFVLAILTCSRLSLAESPAPEVDAKAAEARVRTELVEPLAAKDRKQSKFSRAPMPAQERRVRILDEAPQHDATGGVFYTFALDARHGLRPVGDDKGWRLAAVTGCVYADGEIFVQNGERHRPAAFLLGKNLKPVAEHICKPAAES